MPDSARSNDAAPRDWREAFAALPLEVPAADGWHRVAGRLRPRGPRPRLAPALALAATLAVAIAAAWWIAKPGVGSAPAARTLARTSHDAVPAEAARSPGEPLPRASGHEAVATAMAPTVPDTRARPVGTGTATSRAASTASVAPSGERHGRGRSLVADADTAGTAAGEQLPPPDPRELERLYAESARLEALVELARDDRVASAAAAALASRYDAQVATIDAALVQPETSPAERAALWRDRVAALRQLAGFESTQRLLAAQGERYDARLVSID